MNWSIVGMGAVASIGEDVDAIFGALCAGRSGLADLRAFDRTPFRAHQLFEIDDRQDGVDRPGRATGFLLDAVAAAVADADVTDLSNVPVLVGTGLREHRSVELWARDGVPFGMDGLDFGAALRERFGALDTHTFAGACSASLYALALGADLLAEGSVDTVVVAGVDVVTETMFGSSDRVQIKIPDQVRPFDKGRRGAILGEGAVAIVLRRQGDGDVPAQAILRSVGINCDAFHSTAPDPDGVRAAITTAHRLAGVKAADVDLVVAHGTGTVLNDQVEARVTKEVIGDGPLPVLTGTKSLTGHTSGAAGLLNLVVAVLAMTHGTVPPIGALDDPIEELAGFRVPRGDALEHRAALAQVHAFGFGGVNAVAMVEVPR